MNVVSFEKYYVLFIDLGNGLIEVEKSFDCDELLEFGRSYDLRYKKWMVVGFCYNSESGFGIDVVESGNLEEFFSEFVF
jgi:hypothetical protein